MKYKILTMALTLTGAVVSAHGNATGVVKERMDAMSAIGDANKALTSIARGRTDFELATVVQSAQAIAEHSGQTLLDLFPEGSESETSEAKAEIWANWNEFSSLAMNMETTAMSLSEIQSEAEFGDTYRELSKNCGGCHRKYRSKN